MALCRPAGAAPFPLPEGDRPATWEAEAAAGQGWRTVQNAWASGGAYREPAAGQERPVLEFRFRAERPATLQVWPQWWRHGEQKAAARFPANVPYFHIQQAWPLAHPDPKGAQRLPFPLTGRPGPDAIDWCGSRLYFTAPEAGRVGVLDLQMETLMPAINVGGYPTDLVADREANRIYVADGAGNRVIALDAKTNTVVAQVEVPALPRSLALDGGRLYVACMEGRALAVLETPSLKMARRMKLPIVPQHVAVENGKVLVWPLAGAFEPPTLEERAPDRLVYWPLHPFPQGKLPEPLGWQSFRGLKTNSARVFAQPPHPSVAHVTTPAARIVAGPRPNTLKFRWDDKREAEEVVDVAKVCDAPNVSGLPAELPDDASPDRWGAAGGVLFFTSPATGRVGWQPLKPGEPVGCIAIGGYLSDLAAFNGDVQGKYVDRCLAFLGSREAGRDYSPAKEKVAPKVYVADALGNRVVVIDPATRQVVKEIPVAAMPVALALHGLEVFVACRKGRELAAIDVRTDQVVRRRPLPAEPITLDVSKLQPPYTASEFPPPPAVDDSPLRALIHYQPLAFDAGTLAAAPAPEMSLTDAILYTRRGQVSWKAPDGKTKEAFADNAQMLRVDGRWVDVSALTNAKLAEEPARLTAADTPGTITLSLDGGPAHDWTRSVWVLPETRLFLVNGTDEFRRENAPAFTVGPGEHVLRITGESPHACLDGLLVQRTLARTLQVALRPEPWETHRAVDLPTYQGVFAASEPVRFTLSAKCEVGSAKQPLEVAWRVVHPTAGPGPWHRRKVAVPAGQLQQKAGARSDRSDRSDVIVEIPDEELAGAGTPDRKSKIENRKSGLFVLEVECRSPEGFLALSRRFLRLPKLEHPRLLYRAAEAEAIRRRIAAHPQLFRRWRAWLERHIQDEGFFPREYRETGQDLKVDLAKWRAIACLFSDLFQAPEGKRPFLEHLKPALKGAASGGWSTFQTDFQFGSALAMLYDLAASVSPEIAEVMHRDLAGARTQERALPELMAAIEEPLAPADRAILGWHAVGLGNYLNYFRAHQGTMGGQLWQGLEAQCQCGIHSVARTSLLYRNFLDDPRLVEQGHWPGFYTFQEYAQPRFDVKAFVTPGGIRGNPKDTAGLNMPMRWAITGLSRQPLEKTMTGLDAVIARLDGPLADEVKGVDEVLGAGANAVVPMFVALGWHDPAAPAVAWDEIPPTACFDAEGAAALKSDWGPGMTDVTFFSGVRDVSYRVQPNHLQIFKAGRALLANRVRDYDHGSPTQSWANAVVVGAGLPPEWESGAGYARMDERLIVHRGAPEVPLAVLRDTRHSGIFQQNYPYWFHGGHSGPGMFDLVLHSHTWHPFVSQGRIAAYETWPRFDYVAGDATNVWPAGDVREAYRQVVFLRPDVVVLFDRVVTGGTRKPTRWQAFAPGNVAVEGTTFTVRNDDAFLHATALLPEGAEVKVDRGHTVEVHPRASSTETQYLVVLRTGTGVVQALKPEVVRAPGLAGAAFEYDGTEVKLLFRTAGPAGGRMTLEESGKRILDQELVQGIDLSLRHWKDDPRFPQWVKEPRFRHFVPPADR